MKDRIAIEHSALGRYDDKCMRLCVLGLKRTVEEFMLDINLTGNTLFAKQSSIINSRKSAVPVGIQQISWSECIFSRMADQRDRKSVV